MSGSDVEKVFMYVNHDDEPLRDEDRPGCMGKGVLVALIVTIILAVAGYVIAKVL